MNLSKKQTLRKLVPLLILLAAAPAMLRATVVPLMTVAEIAERSDAIVHGTVSRVWSSWDEQHKFIWTHHEIVVRESLKGPQQPTLVVSEPGGVVDGVGMQISGTPQFRPGEEVVVFAYKTAIGVSRTRGYGQGKYRVLRAAPSRATVRVDIGGIVLVNTSAKEAGPRASSMPSFNGMDLGSFKAAVRSLIGQAKPAKKGSQQ